MTLPTAEIRWIKASACTDINGCVEVALLPDGMVGMRDSKDPNGPVLKWTREAWRGFLAAADDYELTFDGD